MGRGGRPDRFFYLVGPDRERKERKPLCRGKRPPAWLKGGTEVGQNAKTIKTPDKKEKGLKAVKTISPLFSSLFLVPGAGIEPAQPRGPRDFKSLASTSSATQARAFLLMDSRKMVKLNLTFQLHKKQAER
jgi:hypothetical protein